MDERKLFGLGTLLIVAVVGVAIYRAFSPEFSPNASPIPAVTTTTPSQPSVIAEPSAPVADPMGDILDNAKFMRENPHYPDAMAAIIRARGYDCPAVTHLWPKDMHTPDGLQLEALCGPEGTRSAYPQLHYAVYPDKILVRTCARFEAFTEECK